jgi:hypothetical protein
MFGRIQHAESAERVVETVVLALPK